MVHLYLEGKTKEALQLQTKSLSLANALFIETNPIPVKTALNLMNKNAGQLRLPLCEMEKKNKDILLKELKNLNLC